MKQISFNSGVKGRGSDRWWEWRWRLWWDDMWKMKWFVIRKIEMIELG